MTVDPPKVDQGIHTSFSNTLTIPFDRPNQIKQGNENYQAKPIIRLMQLLFASVDAEAMCTVYQYLWWKMLDATIKMIVTAC